MSAWLQRPGVPLFVLLFGTYAYFYQGGGWNQNVRLDLVRSIVERGSVVIDAYHTNTRDLACRGPDGRCLVADPALGRHYYCDKAPGTSWLAAPVALLLDGIAGSPDTDRSLNRRLYLLRLWTVGLLSALATAILPGVVRRLGLSAGVGIVTALGYGLATLAFPYATLFYGHALAGALLLLAFASLLRARDVPVEAPGLDALAGFLCGMAFAVEYPMALPGVALTIYAAVSRRSGRAVLRMAVGCALPLLAVAAYHAVAFGNPWTTPYAFSIAPDRGRGWMGIGAPSPAAVWGLSFGAFRGLFFSSSWLLLAIPGSVHLARRRGARREMWLCAAVALLLFWMNASLVDWAGGWTLGPRYLVPALPFLALLGGGGLSWISATGPRSRRRALAVVAALLLAHSACLMLVGVTVQPIVPIELRSPFGDFLLPAFLDGRLALNPLGAQDATYDAARPGQAWNLGQRMGLSGLWSLLPLALFAGATGAWLSVVRPRALRRGRQPPSSRP